MRIIPTRIHGILDYIVGIIVLGLPYLIDAWQDGGAKVWIPVALGAGTLVYSALTAYELGVVRVIPMKAHLALDALGGVVLAASPFVFGFAGQTWIPYVVLGVFEIGASVLTSPYPAIPSAAERA